MRPTFCKNECTAAPCKRALGRVPALFAFLPKLGCPLCWPVLASVCSFLGLPFWLVNPILTAFTTVAAAATIGWIVRERKITRCSSLMAGALLTILAYRLGGLPSKAISREVGFAH